MHTPGAPEPVELAGQGILDVLVFAAAAFEDEPDFDVVLLPLFEVEHGRALAEVVAAVLTRQRIHGVGAQLPAPRRLRDGLAGGTLDLDLVGAGRRAYVERGHARVLADRVFT